MTKEQKRILERLNALEKRVQRMGSCGGGGEGFEGVFVDNNDTDVILSGNGFQQNPLKAFYKGHTHENQETLNSITQEEVLNWNSAYSWGDHSSEGYLKNIKTINGKSLKGIGNIEIESGEYQGAEGIIVEGNNIKPKYGIQSNTIAEGNDPRFHTHDNKDILNSITNNYLNNWNSAYSWGNHATQGYLKNIKTVNGQSLIGSGDVEIDTFVEATPEINGVVKYDNTTIKKNNEGQLYVVGGWATYTGGDGIYVSPENVISVNFGTSANTAVVGNDSRILNGQTAYTWGNHATQGYIKNNFYTIDGTLSGNRTVGLNGNKLSFNNGITKVDRLELTKLTSNLNPNTTWTDGNDLFFTNNDGVSKIVGGSKVLTAPFNPPTLAQLSSLNIKAGDFYHCSANNQRSLYDGQQLVSWDCTQAVYNALSTEQKNAVKLFNIILA